jgi:hypothetical protein
MSQDGGGWFSRPDAPIKSPFPGIYTDFRPPFLHEWPVLSHQQTSCSKKSTPLGQMDRRAIEDEDALVAGNHGDTLLEWGPCLTSRTSVRSQSPLATHRVTERTGGSDPRHINSQLQELFFVRKGWRRTGQGLSKAAGFENSAGVERLCGTPA